MYNGRRGIEKRSIINETMSVNYELGYIRLQDKYGITRRILMFVRISCVQVSPMHFNEVCTIRFCNNLHQVRS